MNSVHGTIGESDRNARFVDLEPLTYVFADDGLVPNNPLPMLLYSGALDIVTDQSKDEAASALERLFTAHGWGGIWCNGIYDYLHYHATVHEAMGVASGRARVRFGGDAGREIEIGAGDALVLPAGTGHQCLWASDDFIVIGAYPPGARMHITRPTPDNYHAALRLIPRVALPKTDPVSGGRGALVNIWQNAAGRI